MSRYLNAWAASRSGYRRTPRDDSIAGVLAAKLARQMGKETARFKANLRKLKALGLTESLDVGYRLSPRGQALRDRVTS